MNLKLLKKVIAVSKFFFYMVVLQTTFASLAFANDSFGQNFSEIRISCDWKNNRLSDAFMDIQLQTDLFFTYTYETIEDIRISTPKQDYTVMDLLKYIAGETGLQFKISGELIYVYEGMYNPKEKIKIKVPELKSLTHILQHNSDMVIYEVHNNETDQTIKGIITSENGEPLIGATVQVKSTGQGTVTDIDGSFSIAVPNNENTILVVSYIGFQTQEVAVNGRTEINITLKTDAAELDEVIVVGYGTQGKGDVTGAVEKVDIAEVDKTGFLGTEQLLQGRAAGLQISDVSGNPGGEQQINIRGVASIQGSTQPLIVIDGIPVSNSDPSLGTSVLGAVNNQSPLSLINPNDIESVEVLKDASAAAIYGSRANNGVLLITTKKGKEGRTQVNVSAYSGIQDQPVTIETANIDLWLQVNNEARANTNADLGLEPGQDGYLAPLDRPATSVDAVDWIGAITNDQPIISDFNASISGGNKKTNYFASFGYFNQEGWLITNKFQRFSTKLNIEHTASDFFKMGVNFIGSQSINNRVASHEGGLRFIARSLEQRPGDPITFDDGSYNIGGSATLRRHNAFQSLQETDAEYKIYRGIIGAYLEFNLFKGFTYRPSFSTDIGTYRDYIYRTENSIRGRSHKGELLDSRNISSNYLIENLFSYKGSAKDLDYTATFVQAYQQFDINRSFVIGRGFPSPAFRSISSATTILNNRGRSTASLGNAIGKNALASFVGRVVLDYKDKYLLNLAIRSDGSSRFSDGNKWGTFPSASFGWKISREPFFPKNSAISNLKLRTSYGVTGSIDGVGDFAAFPLIAGGANYNNESGLIPIQLGNPDLTWERAKQFDIGLDMEFWEGRMNIGIDYFIQNTDDLLFDRPVHSTTGFTSLTQNLGSIRNTGLEFALDARIIRVKDFNWDINFNFTQINNEVTALDGEIDEIPVGDHSIVKVGETIGSFYMIKQTGIYQNDSEVPEPLFAKGIRAGDIKFEDLNGDGDINASDRQVVGSPLPDFYGGLTNTLSYKNFDLSLFMTYSVGNDVYARWRRSSLDGLGRVDHGLRTESAENRWTGPGTSDTEPRAITTNTPAGNHNATTISTRFLENASFLKIRTLTLGYTFPSSLVGQTNLRAYLNINNLATFTSYSGYNPEVSDSRDPRTFGMDQLAAPPLRAFIFGINLGF